MLKYSVYTFFFFFVVKLEVILNGRLIVLVELSLFWFYLGMQPSLGMGMPLMQPQASLGTATITTGSLGMGPRMANGAVTSFTHGGIAAVPLTGAVPIPGWYFFLLIS